MVKLKTVTIYFILISSAYSFEYSLSIVKLQKFSNKVYTDKVSRYRIISHDNKFILPETPFQKIIKVFNDKKDFSIVIQTGLQNNKENAPGNKYKNETRLADFDMPEIHGLIKRFRVSKDKVKAVETFVYKHIVKKDIGIPIIPASQVFKNKTGDCTEHTVLSVALLRSMGIPARALVGMLLSKKFAGAENVFVYHMWAEAYVNGRWKLIDATRPGTKYPNRYIAFSYHHLKTEMPLSYLKAVSSMKNFSVEYLGDEGI